MSDSSNIQNSLFEAMKIFSDSATANSNAAITIEGEIVEVQDEAAGIYTVDYLGSKITVHSNSDVTYSVGDSVYVLVPEGDFTKEKVILSLITASSSAYTKEIENGENYYDVSDNLVDKNPGVILLSSYDTIRIGERTLDVTDFDTNVFGKIVTGYLENYRAFKFSFSVKTALELSQQCNGNYGACLNIPIIENAATGEGASTETWKQVYLDVGNFNGTPYRYVAWAPQEIYFTIDDQVTYDTSRTPYISYYCYGFTQDENKKDFYDIQMKNFSLTVVNEMTEDETTGYTLFLKASEGEYYSTYYKNAKNIYATLKLNGKVASLNKAELYWFIEDASIKSDSEYYSSYGGYGWRCLNNREQINVTADGEPIYSFITSYQSIEVTRNDVKSQATYKCVVVYNEKVLSSTITLKNLEMDQVVRLVQSRDLTIEDGVAIINTSTNNTYLKDVGYVTLSAITYYEGITESSANRNKILYTWLRRDKNNKYINDEKNFFTTVKNNVLVTVDGKKCYVTQISFPVNKVEELNTISCTAKYVDVDKNNNRYEEMLNTVSIPVVTTLEQGIRLTINGDNICYKYDTDGDSPMGSAYDGPTTSKVTEISPLTFTLTKENGMEFSDEEYQYVHYCWTVPKQSLFSLSAGTSPTDQDDDNYYFEGYGHKFNLLYKIASRFNVGKSKAAINLTVDFQDTTIMESAAITFIKEGMSGSNGTAYSALLVAGGDSASDEKSVGYGILDATGVAQKLKFCYNINSEKLYRHDYKNNQLVEWESNVKRIYPQVWRDSSLLECNVHYTIEYSMFDEKTTNPCFSADNQEDGSCIVSLVSTPTEDNCNIVQAKITITDGNDSVSDSEQIIYAYYPLEMTLTENNSTVIPSLDGGFAEVMYASDGTNPAYDETSNFTINDDSIVRADLGELADYFEVNWSTQSHLGIYEVDLEDAEGTKQTESISSEVRIKPDNKYDDGNSKNFVKAKIAFKADKYQELLDEKDAYLSGIETAQEGLEQEELNYSYLTEVIDSYNANYEDWMESLENIKTLLTAQTSAIYTLNNLKDKTIASTKEYIDYQKTYSEKASAVEQYTQEIYEDLESLDKAIDDAISALQELDGVENTTDDLISLSSYEIYVSSSKQEEWISALGSETARILILDIDTINEAIDDYDSQIKIIKKGSFDNELLIYTEIRNGLVSLANLIDNNASQQYLELKVLIQSVERSFSGGSSYKYLTTQLENLTEILTSVGQIEGEYKIVLSEAVSAEHEETIERYNQLIENNNLKIQALDEVLATKDYTLVHIRPIVLYFNRYGMSNLNAWDGNKVETADGYILAPQVGAGIKEEDNSFTGVVMGLKSITASETSSVYRKGLYGYNSGNQTFALDAENGAAIFGKSGTGQIVIDPVEGNGLLYSSNYWERYNNITGLPAAYLDSNKAGKGLCLDLKNGKIHFGSFDSGVVYSGEHKTFDSTKEGFYLSHDGLSFVGKDSEGHTNKFSISTSSDPTIYTGKHTTFGSTASGYYLGADGLSIGNNFEFNSATDTLSVGKRTSLRKWTISGDSDNSYIAYGTTSYSGDSGVYLGTDGIRLGGYFKVDSDGKLTATNGTFSGTITSSSISIGNSWGDSYFSVSRNGYLTATGASITGEITASTGTIGGWSIGSSTLTGTTTSNGVTKGVILNSGGSIQITDSYNNISTLGASGIVFKTTGNTINSYNSNAEVEVVSGSYRTGISGSCIRVGGYAYDKNWTAMTHTRFYVNLREKVKDTDDNLDTGGLYFRISDNQNMSGLAMKWGTSTIYVGDTDTDTLVRGSSVKIAGEASQYSPKLALSGEISKNGSETVLTIYLG